MTPSDPNTTAIGSYRRAPSVISNPIRMGPTIRWAPSVKNNYFCEALENYSEEL